MTNDKLNQIVQECREISEFDRTSEQQAIVELHDTLVSSYENITGERWNDNLPVIEGTVV